MTSIPQACGGPVARRAALQGLLRRDPSGHPLSGSSTGQAAGPQRRQRLRAGARLRPDPHLRGVRQAGAHPGIRRPGSVHRAGQGRRLAGTLRAGTEGAHVRHDQRHRGPAQVHPGHRRLSEAVSPGLEHLRSQGLDGSSRVVSQGHRAGGQSHGRVPYLRGHPHAGRSPG